MLVPFLALALVRLRPAVNWTLFALIAAATILTLARIERSESSTAEFGVIVVPLLLAVRRRRLWECEGIHIGPMPNCHKRPVTSALAWTHSQDAMREGSTWQHARHGRPEETSALRQQAR
jgi:hypothetical protein